MYFPDRCNELVIAFNTDSEDEMLYYILYKNSEKYAQKYEMCHRDELKSKWNFNLKYDGRKHWFEITVQLLNKIYS